jgi:murein DD-endopeptidase MepM/ murein hydrolase activator NlpD
LAGIGVHAFSPLSLSGSLISPIPSLAGTLPAAGTHIAALRSNLRQDIAALWARSPAMLDPHTESYIMRRGDTLSDLLERAGLDHSTVSNVIDAVHTVYNPKRMQVGQSVDVTYQAPALAAVDRAPTALTFAVAPGQRVAVERQLDGAYAAKSIVAATHHESLRVEGVIDSTLFEAAEQQHLPADVLTAMVQLFSYDVDFQRDLQKGDRFSILFDREVTNDGQAVRNLGIRYASMTVGGSPLELYAFNDDGTVQYYNAKGEGIRKALLRTPVNGATLTSGFGMRHHPILGYTLMHRGVDFGAPIGTPIMAAGDGVIDKREASSSYGNYLRIRHGSGYWTAYAHMSRYGAGMTVGRHVHQGEVIGYVGQTGRATGPHLHFEVLRNLEQVNPITVKFPAQETLTGADLARFQATRASILREFAEKKDGITQTAAVNEPNKATP